MYNRCRVALRLQLDLLAEVDSVYSHNIKDGLITGHG